MQLTDEMSSIVNKAIPGYGALSGGASGIVGNLISGMPSASTSQRSNAYFGAGSGMGGSDFVRNRGFDLYGQQAEASKQRGFDDFFKLLSGYSGTVMPTTGQQQSGSEFDRNLQFQRENAQSQVDLAQQELDLKRQQFDSKRQGKPNSRSEYNTLGQRISHIQFPDSY